MNLLKLKDSTIDLKLKIYKVQSIDKFHSSISPN